MILTSIPFTVSEVMEMLISSSRYPAEIVRSRFLKLRYDHILYVIDCLEKNTNKVKNIRKYLLAALFNAPATMDGYYRAEVRHDMPYIAWETEIYFPIKKRM